MEWYRRCLSPLAPRSASVSISWFSRAFLRSHVRSREDQVRCAVVTYNLHYESSRARFPEDHENPLSSLERWTENERKLARMREEKAHRAALANIDKRAAERAAIARKEKLAATEAYVAELREATEFSAGLSRRGKPSLRRKMALKMETAASVRQVCSCRMQSKITVSSGNCDAEEFLGEKEYQSVLINIFIYKTQRRKKEVNFSFVDGNVCYQIKPKGSAMLGITS
ncbi:hypothetical protein AVEN_81083-1 [Araneus ventricosus]|uniref:Uncharacterized protein n=1 Tax=Araneus ventricosus TaxID=182803 RepID=A0A4Y2JV21_ARAVE|nr:hypothetical protein AVEN_81083-1 [Araneus ventricosus]